MNKLLDTNIVLYLLGDKLEEQLPDGNYNISVITEIELLSYPALNKTTENNIKKFLNELAIVELDSAIKEEAIKLRRTHSLKLPDAIIVATALIIKAEILTIDLRLTRIPKLHCKSLKLKEYSTIIE